MTHKFQQQIAAINAKLQQYRSRHHLTLGKLIEILKQTPKDAHVIFDTDYTLGPDNPHSYRGYYCDLAFAPSIPITAEKLLELCEKSCYEKIFIGYKGGEYYMTSSTPLWMSHWGTTGRAIVYATLGHTERGRVLMLETKDEEEMERV